MRTTSFVALLVAGLCASTAGCSLAEDDADGNVSYQYKAAGCGLYTCTPDNREILAGSAVTVIASSSVPHRLAQLADGAVGTIVTQSETCSCSSESGAETSQLQVADGPCPAKQRKSCSLTVDIETAHPGDATLEILEGAAAVSRTTVKVRAAKRVELGVRSGFELVAPPNGIVEAKVGQIVELWPRVFGENGELFVTKNGVAYAYDTTVVQPKDESVAEALLPLLRLTAQAAGESRVSIKALDDVESAIQIRVVP